MRLLAIDPSSTCVGWALFDGPSLLDAGRLVPESPHASALQRIRRFVDEVGDLVERHQPPKVLIEIPSGHAGRASSGGATGQLAIYGMAVGAIWIDLVHGAPASVRGGCQVLTCTEAAWTRGRPKRRRAEILRMEHPGLDWDADRGLDMADAIGMGAWYLDIEAMRLADAGRSQGGGRA